MPEKQIPPEPLLPDAENEALQQDNTVADRNDRSFALHDRLTLIDNEKNGRVAQINKVLSDRISTTVSPTYKARYQRMLDTFSISYKNLAMRLQKAMHQNRTTPESTNEKQQFTNGVPANYLTDIQQRMISKQFSNTYSGVTVNSGATPDTFVFQIEDPKSAEPFFRDAVAHGLVPKDVQRSVGSVTVTINGFKEGFGYTGPYLESHAPVVPQASLEKSDTESHAESVPVSTTETRREEVENPFSVETTKALDVFEGLLPNGNLVLLRGACDSLRQTMQAELGSIRALPEVEKDTPELKDRIAVLTAYERVLASVLKNDSTLARYVIDVRTERSIQPALTADDAKRASEAAIQDAERTMNDRIRSEQSMISLAEKNRSSTGFFGMFHRTLTLSDPYAIEMSRSRQVIDTMAHLKKQFLDAAKVEPDIQKKADLINSARRVLGMRTVDAYCADTEVVERAMRQVTGTEHYETEDKAIDVSRDVAIEAIVTVGTLGGGALANAGRKGAQIAIEQAVKKTAFQIAKEGIKEGAIAGGVVGGGSSAVRNIDDVAERKKTIATAVADVAKDTAKSAATGAALGGAIRLAGAGLTKLRQPRVPNSTPEPLPSGTPPAAEPTPTLPVESPAVPKESPRPQSQTSPTAEAPPSAPKPQSESGNARVAKPNEGTSPALKPEEAPQKQNTSGANDEHPRAVEEKKNLPEKAANDVNTKKVVFGKEGRRVTDVQASDEYVKNGGWKLHLTVKPENYEAVDRWIYNNHRGQYKLLNGGTHAEGTDFTIYIGSRSQAEAMVRKITNEIDGLLEKNTVGTVEKLFTEKVSGRFDIQLTKKGAQRGLRYYGYDGVPFDEGAMNRGQSVFYKYQGDKNNPQRLVDLHEHWAEEKLRIEKILKKEFGAYYGG